MTSMAGEALLYTAIVKGFVLCLPLRPHCVVVYVGVTMGTLLLFVLIIITVCFYIYSSLYDFLVADSNMCPSKAVNVSTQTAVYDVIIY